MLLSGRAIRMHHTAKFKGLIFTARLLYSMSRDALYRVLEEIFRSIEDWRKRAKRLV